MTVHILERYLRLPAATEAVEGEFALSLWQSCRVEGFRKSVKDCFSAKETLVLAVWNHSDQSFRQPRQLCLLESTLNQGLNFRKSWLGGLHATQVNLSLCSCNAFLQTFIVFSEFNLQTRLE